MTTSDPILADGVDALLSYVDDPARREPVVIISVSPRGERPYGVAPRRIARAVHGTATVWRLPDVDHSWQLRRARPELATYGGALRIVGADGRSEIVRTDADEAAVLTSLKNCVASARRRASSAASKPSYPAVQETARRGLGDSSSAAAQGIIAELRAQLERAAADYAAAERALTDRVDALEQALVQERDTTSRLRSEVRDLLRTNEQQGQVIRDLTHAQEVASRPVFTDPERQFRHDVECHWLRHLPEPERERWPLRQYRLGPNFLSTLDTELASRTKIVEVTVDVVTRRAYEIPARGVHLHHTNEAGGTAMVRADGATAYRCRVKNGTPAAARLLFWECTDGTVELAQVGHHDAALQGYQRRDIAS